ncbi:flippase [Pedobacter africanus]|uniref:Membrane protein involved in the export of O-antigen and teichoic acid n=1 Tax=Pedobacter africanus TaxID=151894 RepID=A0A1W2BMD0_9SPHI|nr:flippase [Pedobacter africanus]SMC74067.1 Membrane protein involved in the export of O-antigen and teichoic acid [Pedobacter africanus]
MKFPAIKGFDHEAFNKYLKNTGMLMFGKIGSLVIKMLVSIQIANHLGAFNNGILNGAIVYVALFAAVASLGLDQFTVKELHAYPEERDRILGTAFGMRLMAGLLCIPVIYLSWQFFGLEKTPYLYVLILSFTGFFQSFNIIDSYFQSEVQSKYIMQVQITATLLAAGIKLVLIFSNCALVWFVYASIFDFISLALGYLAVYNRKGRSVGQWKFDLRLARKLISFSWPLIISGIMVSLYMYIDQLMLHEMSGPAAQGLYSTAVAFSSAWYFVPTIIVSSLFPAILNARRDDPERYQKRLQNLYDIMVWFSILFALVVTIAAPLIYKLFKPEYASAAPILAVHVWSGIFVFLGTANTQYMIAENLNKITFIRTTVGAIVNILLNLWLIPVMGPLGAAVATLISYFVSTFFVVFIPQLRRQALMMLKSLFLITLFQKIRKR